MADGGMMLLVFQVVTSKGKAWGRGNQMAGECGMTCIT